MTDIRTKEGLQYPQLHLDETLAKIVVKSVQKAISLLFTTHAQPGTFTIEKNYTSTGDVSGILGMVQDTIEATLVVSFQKETLFVLLGKMYEKSYDKIDSSIKQGVGELTNIIYASVKKDLNDRGHSFKMSIPSVVIGGGHSIFSVNEGKSMVVPFKVDPGGEFFLQITLQSSQ